MSEAMPTFESFAWDSTGWQASTVKPEKVIWRNALGDFAVKIFKIEVPTGLPNDWRDVDALRASLIENQPAKVAVVSVDVLTLPVGLLCAQYICKEFMAAPSLGHMYSGMITMPFCDFYCNFFFAAVEHGTTGMREAALVAAGKVDMPRTPNPPHVESAAELEALYRKAREGRPKVIGTDDEQWDSKFPDHPISRVRDHLRRLRETLSVDASVKSFAPFGS